MKIHATGHTFDIIGFAQKANHHCCALHIKLVMLLLVLSNLFAVHASAISTHYIIAFDQSVGKYHSDYLSPKTLVSLTTILKGADFNPENDYLSMVGYTMEMGEPSLDRFVRPYMNFEGDTIKWLTLHDVDLSTMFKDWPQGQPLLNPHGSPYGSMQSLSKPYIVMETHTTTASSKYADRTIMLLVTDEVVNGTDDNYAQEWNNVSTSLGADYLKFKDLAQGVFSKMQSFNEEFKFVQVPLGKNKKTRFALSSDGVYKIIPYEVVAVDKPSIHSVTDFPSPLPLQRIRGGFKLAVETKSINEKYEIHQIALYNKNGKQLGQVSDGDFDLIISSNDVHAGDTLVASLSLRMKDGFYNGTLISSDNFRYKKGMVSKQVVKIQDEAKVLGLIPLSDAFWWWFPNDIFTAVMVWDLIILIIVIVMVGYILYMCFVRINSYKPSNDKLKITKI